MEQYPIYYYYYYRICSWVTLRVRKSSYCTPIQFFLLSCNYSDAKNAFLKYILIWIFFIVTTGNKHPFILAKKKNGDRKIVFNFLSQFFLFILLTFPRLNGRLFCVQRISVSGMEPTTSQWMLYSISDAKCFGFDVMLIEVGFTEKKSHIEKQSKK